MSVAPTAAQVATALPRRGADADLLARAARAGRVRGIGLDLWEHTRASPHAASGILRRGLREARALHSRERRFVGDLVHDLHRAEPLLAALLGTSDAPALWDAWLAWQGVDPELVAPEARIAVHLDEAAATALAALPPGAAWGLLAGVPAAVGAELLAVLGEELTPFLAACAGRAPVVLRASPKPGREALVAAMASLGAEPGVHAATAVVLPAGVDLQPWAARMPGAFEVQDEASQLVADLVGGRPGLRVLDACAGAGGKALALAASGAQVVAADVRAQALDALQRRAWEAGLRIRTELWPPHGGLGGGFDVVLVDAPCSGTGTWRRHPELRGRLDTLPATHHLQDEVLERAVAEVRPGGRLIYATCSVLPSEDEDRVAALRERHPEFRTVDVGAPGHLRSGPYLRTWPHRHGTDGFFAAVLERSA